MAFKCVQNSHAAMSLKRHLRFYFLNLNKSELIKRSCIDKNNQPNSFFTTITDSTWRRKTNRRHADTIAVLCWYETILAWRFQLFYNYVESRVHQSDSCKCRYPECMWGVCVGGRGCGSVGALDVCVWVRVGGYVGIFLFVLWYFSVHCF